MISNYFKNKKLKEVLFDYDDIGLNFENGNMVIYNPIILKFKEKEFDFKKYYLEIVDKKVENIFEKDKSFFIVFENKFEIIISLKDEDYTCPEAVNIFVDDKIIVF